MTNKFVSSVEWPAVARTVAEVTDRGVRAARTHDLDGFGEAVGVLEIHAEVAREVHAHMVRELLETLYQDGLSGDDVSEVLTRTTDDAGLWYAPVDPSAVVVVLTGALGVGEGSVSSDVRPQSIPPAEIIGAAFLVIADLAASAGLEHEPYLVRAVEEIRRAQTVEMP